MGEKEVLDQLLCDGAGTFGDFSVLEIDERSPHNALHIKTVMTVKAVVLHGDDGVLHILGNIPELYIMFLVDTGIYCTLEENDAAEPVDGRYFLGAVILLISRLNGFELRQKTSDILPGAGGKERSAARQKEGDKEDQA